MKIIDALFSFIRAGLDIDCSTRPGDVNWNLLYKTALDHGVIAIVSEGVTKALNSGVLFEGLNPRLRKQFAFQTIIVEQHFETTWKSAKDLSLLFHKNGIRTYGLKGFVTCGFYPHPKHRIFTDFDCYLSDFKRGNELVKEMGIEVAGSYKHSTFNYKSTHVENHQFCTHFRGRKKAYQFERTLQEIMPPDTIDYIYDSFIERPSPLFNALFLTHHARSHFFDERVSLRQVIDWAMLISFYGNDGLDWNRFLEICGQYGLLTFAQVMSRLARNICHIDLPFDCPDNEKLDQLLFDDIFSDAQEHVEYGTGMKVRLQIVRNKYKARWKYKYFSDQSFFSAMWQQLWGYITERAPSR